MFPRLIGLLLPLIQLTACEFSYIKLRESGTHNYGMYGDSLITFDKIRSSGQWEFANPNIRFQVKLLYVEFFQTAGSCQGQLKIWNGNKEVNIDCKTKYENEIFFPRYLNGNYLYRGNYRNGYHYRIYIYGQQVNFTAVITLCPWLADPMGVNSSESGEDGQFIVHSYSPDQLGMLTQQEFIRQTRLRDSEPVGLRDYLPKYGIVSSEIVTSSGFTGNLFKNCTILKPIADIPSCNADALESCDWKSTVKSDYYNKTTNIQGKAFKVSNADVEFETENDALYLDKICVNVLYLSNGTSSMQLYIREKQDWKGLISSAVLNPVKVFTNNRIISNIPNLKKGAPIQVIIRITGSNINPVYIKQIYGCNPYSEEDRYQMASDPNKYDMMVYTIEGLKTVEFNDIANIPYGLKELREDPHCLHGGKLDGDRCVCPAGFVGENCQTGCGENKFGTHCESRCSFNENKCKGKVICVPNLGCSCAPGWRGAYCNEGCSDKMYGIGCGFSCGHCLDGSGCDNFTGACTKGCQSGYLPPLCQTKKSYLKQTPVVTDIGYNSAVVTMNTIDDIRFYMVQYKNLSENTDVWLETPVKEWRRGTNIKERLLCLKAGKKYAVRLVTFNEEMSSYEEEDLPSTVFETHCVENPLNITESVSETEIYLEWKETSVDVNRCDSGRHQVQVLYGSVWSSYTSTNNSFYLGSLVPATKYVIRIREDRQNSKFYFKTVSTLRKVTGRVENLRIGKRTQNTIELKWGDDEEPISNYTLQYQCLMILSSRKTCEWDSGVLTSKTSRTVIEGLRPFRKYQIKIHELPGSDYSQIVTSTKPAVADVGPELLSVSASNTSVTLSWSPPENCSGCNSFITGYFVKVLAEDNSSVASEGIESNMFQVNKLIPGSLYKFYIYIVNSEGKSTVPLIVNTITLSTGPSSVVELEAYKTGRREIGLRWSLPRELFGELVAFRIGENLVKPEPCSAWPSRYCHTVQHLTPDTTYNFSVSAQNDKVEENGAVTYISASTVEKAPGEPLNLTVYNETETSITISWEPPKFFNGILRSFLIKVEQTESYNISDCCEYYPKNEILVKKEQPRYEYQISGLSKGSRFAVSVMGETVWLGPAARTSACTRPPAPTIPQPPTTLISSPDNATLTLDWPHLPTSQLSTADDNSTHLIEGNLILVLPASEETPMNATFWDDKDFKEVVDKNFGGQRYYVGAHSGSFVGETVEVEGLVAGQSYSLVLVAVAKYCHLYTISSLTSSQFEAP